MIPLNTQKNKWRAFIKERRYNLAFFSLSPAGDWRIIIRIFATLLILSLAIGFWSSNQMIKSIYYRNAEGGAGEIRLVDLEKADKIIADFETRRTVFEAGFESGVEAGSVEEN